MNNNPGQLLDALAERASALQAKQKKPKLPEQIETSLAAVADLAEPAKGVVTVLLTSAVYKILHPEQDIRCHQSSIAQGYSGRSFDTANITPWLQNNRLPAMRESGWLTRSLEHKVPYDRNYTGAIRPAHLKEAFLALIDYIQHSATPVIEELVVALLQELFLIRERNSLQLIIPANLSIADIANVLNKHFHSTYHFEGAARLPVLAVYAIYSQLMAKWVDFMARNRSRLRAIRLPIRKVDGWAI